ncbi:hypothetical protein L3V83_06530 [Thiotrichales bacterium 19X7-9]|nr:hypothetical protein [Thiotrichales bacterium 19X7-9]
MDKIINDILSALKSNQLELAIEQLITLGRLIFQTYPGITNDKVCKKLNRPDGIQLDLEDTAAITALYEAINKTYENVVDNGADFKDPSIQNFLAPAKLAIVLFTPSDDFDVDTDYSENLYDEALQKCDIKLETIHIDHQISITENYINSLNNNKKSQEFQDYKISVNHLKNELIEDASNQKPTKYKSSYSYTQLQQLKNLTQTVNNNSTEDVKELAIDNYKKQAQKESSGWAKFGKSILAVTVGALYIASCTFLGAAIGSLASPVGTVAGGAVGFTFGASTYASALGYIFYDKDQDEILAEKTADQAKSLIQN